MKLTHEEKNLLQSVLKHELKRLETEEDINIIMEYRKTIINLIEKLKKEKCEF